MEIKTRQQAHAKASALWGDGRGIAILSRKSDPARYKVGYYEGAKFILMGSSSKNWQEALDRSLIGAAEIRALRAEAEVAKDFDMVATCDKALSGNDDAWFKAINCIIDARQRG